MATRATGCASSMLKIPLFNIMTCCRSAWPSCYESITRDFKLSFRNPRCTETLPRTSTGHPVALEAIFLELFLSSAWNADNRSEASTSYSILLNNLVPWRGTCCTKKPSWRRSQQSAPDNWLSLRVSLCRMVLHWKKWSNSHTCGNQRGFSLKTKATADTGSFLCTQRQAKKPFEEIQKAVLGLTPFFGETVSKACRLAGVLQCVNTLGCKSSERHVLWVLSSTPECKNKSESLLHKHRQP